MPSPFTRVYALAADDGGDGLPYLNAEGAFIGRGTPLLETDAAGRWTPRPARRHIQKDKPARRRRHLAYQL